MLSGHGVLEEKELQTKLLRISIHEESHPIENEEWIVFLQRTIMEVMNGELTTLMQCNLANIVVSPLRNRNASPKVLQYVANIFSLPFVVRNSMENSLETIQKVRHSRIYRWQLLHAYVLHCLQLLAPIILSISGIY